MTPFTQNLLNDFNKAILCGYKKFIIWGWNNYGIELISEINNLKLNNFIVGIIDNNIPENQKFGEIELYPVSFISNISFDSIIITYDDEKEDILIYLKKFPSSVHLIFSGIGNYNFNNTTFKDIQKNCFIKSKAGGYENMLIHIFQSVQYIIQNNIDGDFVELGTFKGGTTFFIADILKKMKCNKKIISFDTFEGFPDKLSVLDTFIDEKYSNNNFEKLKKYSNYYENVELVKGNILQTIPMLSSTAISFLFCDTDNFSATNASLNLLYSKISSGGILAFDHFYSPGWEKTIGERIAVKEALKNKNVFNLHGTGIFLKVS